MKMYNTVFLISLFLYSSISFGSLSGQDTKKKSKSSIDNKNTSVIGEINKNEDSVEIPSIEILGTKYPLNNIDLSADIICENHTKEELFEIFSNALEKSTLSKKDDSIEDSYQKYVAAGFAAGHLIKGFYFFVVNLASTSVRNLTELKFDSLYRLHHRAPLGLARNLCREYMFRQQPYDSRDFINRYNKYMGYKGLDNHINSGTLYLSKIPFESRPFSYRAELEQAEKYGLCVLIKSIYNYWQEKNNEILKEINSDIPDRDSINRWIRRHKTRVSMFNRKSDNPYLNIFRKEIFRFTDNLNINVNVLDENDCIFRRIR